jgi:hypothetical protein
MKETTPPEAANSASTPSKSSSWGRKLLFATIVLVLMASSSYATYTWQERKLAQLNTTLNTSKDKIDFLTEQQDTLTKELSSLSAQNSELAQLAPNQAEVQEIISKPAEPSSPDKPAPPVPKFEVLGYQKHHDPKRRAVIVEFSITNPSAESQALIVSEFVLKGEHSTSGAGESAGETLPNGSTVLSSRLMAPGETVKGAMIFGSLDVPTGRYVLTYKDQSFTFFL